MIVPDDRTGLNARLSALQYGLAAGFVVLTMCFWVLQILQHEKYLELAENNHQRTIALRAPRGVLFDRAGRVLVQNRDALNISLVREQTRDLDRSVRMLAAVTGVEERAVRDIVERNRSLPRYQPIRILQDATMAQIASVAARRHEMGDVLLEPVPTRRLSRAVVCGARLRLRRRGHRRTARAPGLRGAPAGRAHRSGGRGADLQQAPDGPRRRAARDGEQRRARDQGSGPHRAQRGAARPAHDRLRRPEGRAGRLPAVELQRLGRDARRAERRDPGAGEPAGVRSQRLRWRDRGAQLVGAAQRPAAAAPEPRDSGPLFPGVHVQDRGGGRRPRGRPHHARVRGRSVRGGATFYGRFFKCHAGGPHGSIDLRHAIEKSCNVYFYTLGNLVGIDRMHKWAAALGLGEMSGIDLPHEIQGIMPSTEWKRQRPARSGTRARRSRCRSARGRCRSRRSRSPS